MFKAITDTINYCTPTNETLNTIANHTNTIRNYVSESLESLQSRVASLNYTDLAEQTKNATMTKLTQIGLNILPSNSSEMLNKATNFSIVEQVTAMIPPSPAEILDQIKNYSPLTNVKNYALTQLSSLWGNTKGFLGQQIENCSDSDSMLCTPVNALLELSPKKLCSNAFNNLHSLATSKETYYTIGNTVLFSVQTVGKTLQDITQIELSDSITSPLEHTIAAIIIAVPLALAGYTTWQWSTAKPSNPGTQAATTPPVTAPKDYNYSPIILGAGSGAFLSSLFSSDPLSLLAGASLGTAAGWIHSGVHSIGNSLLEKTRQVIPAVTQTIPSLCKATPAILSTIGLSWVNNVVGELTGLPLKDRIVLTTAVSGASLLAVNLTGNAVALLLKDSYKSIVRLSKTAITLGELAVLYKAVELVEAFPASRFIPPALIAAYTANNYFNSKKQTTNP